MSRSIAVQRGSVALIGHRHRDPIFGHVISFYMPSAEGQMGVSDPRGRLVGTCDCGHEWRAAA